MQHRKAGLAQGTGGERDRFAYSVFMVFDAKRVWDYLPDKDPGRVLEVEPLQWIAAAGELVAYEHHGFWQPMDTLREYTVLNNLWASGNAPWKTWND